MSLRTGMIRKTRHSMKSVVRHEQRMNKLEQQVIELEQQVIELEQRYQYLAEFNYPQPNWEDNDEA